MLPVKWWAKPNFVQSRIGLEVNFLTKAEPLNCCCGDGLNSDAKGDKFTNDDTKVQKTFLIYIWMYICILSSPKNSQIPDQL